MLFFQFPARKHSPLPLNEQGSPTGWLAGEKSSSLRSGIFLRQALHNQRQRGQPGKQEIEIPALRSRTCIT